MKALFRAFCIVAISLHYGFAESKSLSNEIFREAKVIFETMHDTHYDHKTFINEKQGIYYVDCSSFISYVVQQKVPLALSSLTIDAHHTRLRAQNFYDYFKSLQQGQSSEHWMAVTSMSEVEVGDIIAWKYSPQEQQEKKNTGHMIVVAAKPILEAPNLYKIRVIDSSSGKHANDTRTLQKTDGIGMGEMWFRVDEQGYPVGLYWSDKNKKESQHLIAIGRVLSSK